MVSLTISYSVLVFKVHFSIQLQWFWQLVFQFISWIYSSESSNLLFIPSSVVFLFQLLHSSALFGSYLYFQPLKNFKLFTLLSIFLMNYLSVFMIIFLNSLIDRLLMPLSSFVVHLVPSVGTYSSVTSFCLTSYFYFYVFGKLIILPDLGKMASV